MTAKNPNEVDESVRERILSRVKEINQKLLTRLGSAAEDLDNNRHFAALGGLDGIEREIADMRSFLLLLR